TPGSGFSRSSGSTSEPASPWFAGGRSTVEDSAWTESSGERYVAGITGRAGERDAMAGADRTGHLPRPTSQPKLVIAALVLALVLETVCAWSYLGAFHKPKPRGLPVAVVVRSPASPGSSAALRNVQRVAPTVSLRPVPDEATALRQIRQRAVYGAFVPGNP